MTTKLDDAPRTASARSDQEEEALNEAKLRRDVDTAEASLEQVNEDLEQIRGHLLPGRSDSELAVLVHDLIPVIDTLDEAIESGTEDVRELRQAIGRARQHLLALLLDQGISVELSIGQPYNPGRHRLHCLESDTTKLGNTILKVVERGYRRGKEVFRPAKVIVNVTDQAGIGDGS